MRKALDWIKAKWRWIVGAVVGGLALVALSFRTSGGTPVTEHTRDTVPPPPPPVPPILEVEAGNAAVEAERAREAPATLDGDAVAEGLARHARRKP